MRFSPLIDALIEAFRCLPGVGPKTAQRMAFHLLLKDRAKGQELADTIADAVQQVGQCEQCRTLSEQKLCNICSNSKRDSSLLCVVETPADILAIEQTSIYSGHYFVLMGHLSPLDGIGPSHLGMDELYQRIEGVKELIIATNHTIEGEATAHYIFEMVKSLPLRVSRIAHGIPMGGELEMTDARTLADALSGR
ncbi:MAG: recombination mediator RecR, partial [Gammaproteobacteria bacterium]|nr:recombination mediator RecR [Gammaproteobacteria bacterium]